MEEMGYQDWADRTEKTCIVLADHNDKHAYVPVPQTGKRITLMVSMDADGSVLKLEIINPMTATWLQGDRALRFTARDNFPP
jgi:hypothetical protein